MLATHAGAQTCSPDVLGSYTSGWPKELDVGIYWFGKNDQFEKAYAGQPNTYYNPKLPTLIYFHGWAGGGQNDDKGWVMNCKRVTGRCPTEACSAAAGPVMLLESWIDAGWNVGFFYWDQFADEECERDAEQKLWFDRKGDGLRWKSYDVGSNTFAWEQVVGDNSLASIALSSIKSVLADFSGQEVRLVGHSIGSQLAVQIASKLHEENHPAAPQRLAMLEPFFTRHHTYFWGCKESDSADVHGFTAAYTAGMVGSLWKDHKVVTEVYKSSPLTQSEDFGNVDQDLMSHATLVIYDPKWCGELVTGMGESLGAMTGTMRNLGCYHVAVVPYYFLQYGMPPRMLNPPPPQNNAVPGSALLGCSTPSSTCSVGQLKEWVSRNEDAAVAGTQRWVQQTGMTTFNQSDDSFKLLPDLMQASDAVVVDPAVVFPAKTEQRSWLAQVGLEGGEDRSLPKWLTDNSILGAVLLATAAFCCGLLGVVCVASRTRKFDDESGTEYDSSLDEQLREMSNGSYKLGGNDYGVSVPLNSSRSGVPGSPGPQR